jgi:hypothetical protein
MLSVMILATLALLPDDPPKPKVGPAAMVLDFKGKVEIRPAEGQPRAAETGDLLYPGERLAVPAGSTATLSILGVGARETIKPGTEITIGPKGCVPSESIASRREQPKAVATTMKNLRPTPGDGRKAGVGFRGGPDKPQAITPIFGATVTSDRPGLAWPPAEKAETYRVKLLSGASRELWKVESREPRVAFPEGREPLQPGYVYRWEVTDQDFRKVASGEFTAATASERQQIEVLKELGRSGDRADRLSIAMAYRRLGAYDEAIAAYEGLARESPEDSTLLQGLDDLQRIAGLRKEAPTVDPAKKPGSH